MYFDPLSAVRFIKTSRLFEFLQQTAVSENNVRMQAALTRHEKTREHASSARGKIFKLRKLYTNINGLFQGKTAEIHFKQSDISY